MARQRCLRCGGPAPEGAAICGRCNPAGLPGPSSSQYHATVFVIVLLTIAIAVAFLIVRG